MGALVLAACDSATPTPVVVSDASVDSTAPDAATDAATGAGQVPSTCEGACRGITLMASGGGKTIAFDRAQFGYNGGDRALYIESYKGGDAACPTQQSKTPDATLVLSGVTVPSIGRSLTEADGLTLSLLDFAGTIVTSGNPTIKAVHIRLTPQAFAAGQGADALFAYDLIAEFPNAVTVTGHAFATHCASLD